MDLVEYYARLYIREIVRFYGVSLSTILDRGVQFTTQFLKSFQKGLGLKLNFSTTFHPKKDGYHSNIQMALYEALYGQMCRSLIGWSEVGEAKLIGTYLVHQAMEKVKTIRKRLKTTESRQKSYIHVRCMDLEFEVDDWVCIKVSPM
ncbi:hypothetical protein MTR67_040009 [Solanum verrucosum]|uniref:Integrase catalytic domain-containing protein n=1 Tax=Solanum verrucosum TaxID=315347 RepID=A0AAF0ZRQ8_SOLVR|nr:hypothetical protein MTR67_040009 [Solanum verrucosum]